jgi:hypothetical protein
MMMKNAFKFFAVAMLLIVSLASRGQNLTTVIKTQALDMTRAIIRNDLAGFSKYLHPKLIAYAGGVQKMKEKMDSAKMQMKQFGVTIKKILIGDPGPVISYQNELQSVLPQTTTIQSAFGDVILTTSIVAISPDKGKHWYFIDTNVYRGDKLKSILPGLSPQLVIPAQQKPKFVPIKDQD